MSARANLKLVNNPTPLRIFGKVGKLGPQPPKKPGNRDRRPREHLTETEVKAIAAAADKRGRYGYRDKTMILVCFRHGLRVQELVDLKWEQVNLNEALMSVHRVKGGRNTEHPIPGSELRDLRRLKREQTAGSRFVFTTERGGPMTPNAFGRIRTKAAEAIAFPFPVHPHMLRHAAGYKLVSERQPIREVQRYLGHRRIASTEVYTDAAPNQFTNFFE